MTDPLNGTLCRVIQGDALAVLPTLPAGCVHLALTSPAYWKLRSYLDKDHRDKEHELGSEELHDCNGWATGSRCGVCYLCRLLAVFAEVRRVLRDDGVLVVNLGDSYSSSPSNQQGAARNGFHGGSSERWAKQGRQDRSHLGLEEGSLCGIPWRFALAMQSAGWCLRSSVIWGKLSPMPESVQGWRWERHRVKLKKGLQYGDTKQGGHGRRYDGFNERYFDGQGAEWEPCPGCKKCSPHGGYVLRKGSWRPTRSHEHVFVFTKGGGPYWCDGDAVRTPLAPRTTGNYDYPFAGTRNETLVEMNNQGVGVRTRMIGYRNVPEGANLRDVLWLSPEPASCACICHPAPDCPVHAGQPGPIYVDRPPPSWKRCKCDQTLHFAAFPSTLCRPFLEAFCPQRCCAECGTGWVRVVERETDVRTPYVTVGVGDKATTVRDEGSNRRGVHKVLREDGRGGDLATTQTTTLGWRPACNCQSQAEPVAGLCLDPFSGTGTLALTARRMGLRALGVELSEGYCTLSRCRLQADQPLFNGVANG